MKRLLAFILSLLILTGTVIAGGGEYTEDVSVGLDAVSVSAQSFCLMDASTGSILHSKDEKTRLPMASTTKIMTAIVAIENADLAQTVEITKESVGIEGSSIYLYEGETMTLHDLLYALMLQSANDAAVAIAIHVSGSVECFVEMMNETARRLDLADTQFKNPHGLSESGHYSTAADMSRLMAYAMQNEVFASLVATESYRIPLNDGKNYRYITNHNRLLKGYNSCIGGKTGYTVSAGRCLVTAAKRDGALLICTTLNAPDDWNDHEKLFEGGFSLFEKKLLCVAGGVTHKVSVVGGEKSEVELINVDALEVSVAKDSQIKLQIHVFPFLYAPITGLEGGAAVPYGEAVYFRDGKEIASVMLYAKESIAYKKNKSLWEKIKGFFGL